MDDIYIYIFEYLFLFVRNSGGFRICTQWTTAQVLPFRRHSSASATFGDGHVNVPGTGNASFSPTAMKQGPMAYAED